jgi:hypothetical protein
LAFDGRGNARKALHQPLDHLEHSTRPFKIETTKNIYGRLFAQDRAFILKAINQAVSRLQVHEATDEDAA